MEEMDTEYKPFLKYFNCTSNLQNKYNHINFSWFTVGTETEEMDMECKSLVIEAELPGDKVGKDEGKGDGDNGEAME